MIPPSHSPTPHIHSVDIPCVVVWFRNDLRILDHAPLTQACQTNKIIVGIYIFDDNQYTKTKHYGFPKTGPHRAKFIRESVLDLQQQLHHIGIPLYMSKGQSSHGFITLIDFLKKHQLFVEQIFYGEETGQEERNQIYACQQVPQLKSLKWSGIRTNDLYDFQLFGDLTKWPDVFTSFRVQIEKHYFPPTPLPIPHYANADNQYLLDEIHKISYLPSMEDLGAMEPSLDHRSLMQWHGGTTAGQHRLQFYLFDTDLIAQYKLTRNGLLSPQDSSRLSAWLAQGCLSAREVYAAIQQYEQSRIKNESTYWLWFELLWRDFFRYVHLKYSNRIFQQSGIQQRTKSWKYDIELMQAWKTGHTNYPLVDASMQELNTTGYTTNRARQNAASLLAQTMQIDWLFGAELYESQLIDYDPASNYGNWMYLAGVGNDARVDRHFNVIKQAQLYDPQETYIKHWT
jgi:deoxyribodipyrimidine photo-lyase